MGQYFIDALRLLTALDAEVIEIVLLTLKVSLSAVFISLLLGIPLGMYLTFSTSKLRRFVLSLVNTGMGAPPVVVGLIVFLFLSRSGPLGELDLLYTPTAMVIAEVLLGLPVVAGLSYSALSSVPSELVLQALGLGATRWQAVYVVLRESRLGMLAALMAGFGAIISEVGAVLMVGGNIRHQTRVLTTSIVLETRMGNFSMAIALAVILFLITFLANYVFTSIQARGEGQNWLSRSWR